MNWWGKLGSLGGLVATAILCLSPVIIWFEFRNKYLNYINLLKSSSFDILENIRKELNEMKVWTGREGYNQNSHDNTWYVPNWRVKPFPFGNIRKYIWTLAHTKKYKEFNRALDKLGKAIENFESLLEEHQTIRSVFSDDQREKLEHKINWMLLALEQSDVNYSKYDRDFDLLNENLATITDSATLEDNEIAFLREVYLANKAIHEEGIGDTSSESSLYSTRNKAEEELETAFKKIPKLKASRWSFIGTVLAVIFGLIGLTYLGRFVFELFGLPGLITATVILSIVMFTMLVWERINARERN